MNDDPKRAAARLQPPADMWNYLSACRVLPVRRHNTPGGNTRAQTRPRQRRMQVCGWEKTALARGSRKGPDLTRA